MKKLVDLIDKIPPLLISGIALGFSLGSLMMTLIKVLR